MYHLKGKYPYAFWADPNEFFTDGPKINKGSDFGLMPSLFEPGGIVQHEFFIAGTPVIAFRTGGLKDTVKDDGEISGEGTGFIFNRYDKKELFQTLDRAYRMYEDHIGEWNQRIRAGMMEDFSWTHSAKAYKKMYLSLAEE